MWSLSIGGKTANRSLQNTHAVLDHLEVQNKWNNSAKAWASHMEAALDTSHYLITTDTPFKFMAHKQAKQNEQNDYKK